MTESEKIKAVKGILELTNQALVIVEKYLREYAKIMLIERGGK